jgi:hypothetical protein
MSAAALLLAFMGLLAHFGARRSRLRLAPAGRLGPRSMVRRRHDKEAATCRPRASRYLAQVKWVIAWVAACALIGCTQAPTRGKDPTLRGPAGPRAGSHGPHPSAGTNGAGDGAGAGAGQAGSEPAEKDAGPDAMAPDLDASVDGSIDRQDAAPDAAIDEEPTVQITYTFEPFELNGSEERRDVCHSWALGNEEPLFVHRVRGTDDGGVYRSSFAWVEEAQYTGPDGTFPCGEHGLDPILASGLGGALFLQSEHSKRDEIALPKGVAFELPARARIVGELHLLNLSDHLTTTRFQLVLDTLAEADVAVKLKPLSLANIALEVAANSDSRARTQCVGPAPDFNVYYVLPHYHRTGVALHLGAVGGTHDGRTIWSGYGEPLGEVLDPPLRLGGVIGLELLCEYFNPLAEVLSYWTGAREICGALLYTDAAQRGGVASTLLAREEINGVHETDAVCFAVHPP